MLCSHNLCGHFALDTLWETYFEDVVFETHVCREHKPNIEHSAHDIFDTPTASVGVWEKPNKFS